MITSIFGKTLVAITIFVLATILILGILIFLFMIGVFLYNYLFRVKKIN